MDSTPPHQPEIRTVVNNSRVLNSTSGNGSARTQNPLRRQTPVGDVKCWTCGKTGHYAYDCKSSGPKFAFAPKALKINFLQQIADQVQEYSEEQQNPRSGND